jgi:hypothetical protein
VEQPGSSSGTPHIAKNQLVLNFVQQLYSKNTHQAGAWLLTKIASTLLRTVFHPAARAMMPDIGLSHSAIPK